MDDDNRSFLLGIVAGVVVGIFICLLLTVIVDPVIISKETVDDICQQLTGNKEAVGDSRDGVRLICEIPSFDETQNIIIRRNDE